LRQLHGSVKLMVGVQLLVVDEVRIYSLEKNLRIAVNNIKVWIIFYSTTGAKT